MIAYAVANSITGEVKFFHRLEALDVFIEENQYHDGWFRYEEGDLK